MSVYVLKRVQWLPISLEKAWDFFSTPSNLNEITPPGMHFHIRINGGQVPAMYPGQMIVYTVRPLLRIPMLWVTEITHVREGVFFVDEQRIGPYRLWHHEHHFKPVEGGVEMTDIVHYQLPLGWLGRLAHALFVRRQLASIFDYRYQVLEKHFGK